MKMNVIGPGLWYSIHRMSLLIKSTEQLREFETYILNMVEILPCTDCKSHYGEELSIFMSQMPGVYSDYRTSLSVFKLTVDLHNNVNLRLHKNRLSYIEALTIYDTDKFYITKVEESKRSKRNGFSETVNRSIYNVGVDGNSGINANVYSDFPRPVNNIQTLRNPYEINNVVKNGSNLPEYLKPIQGRLPPQNYNNSAKNITYVGKQGKSCGCG